MKQNILIVLLCSSFLCTAQSLESQVIASFGSSISAGSILVDHTVGDLYVSTNSTGGLQADHGFQQFFGSGIGLNEFVNALDIKVYPVPTFDYVTVSLPELIADGARLWLTTIEGRVVQLENNTIIVSRGIDTQLNLEGLPSGTFFLYVSHPKLKETKIFRITKLI
jgi:hypothetical protein